MVESGSGKRDVFDPSDLPESFRRSVTAAQAGDIDAQFDLGILLSELDPPDLAEARRWFAAAAEAGHTGARMKLQALAKNESGTTAGVAEQPQGRSKALGRIADTR